MPDGFDPKLELERIVTLRELMTACRKRVPIVLRELDKILDDDTIHPGLKLSAMEMVLNRGYGKPRQTVVIADPSEHTVNPVKVYIPHNNRDPLQSDPTLPPLIIDQSGEPQEPGTC